MKRSRLLKDKTPRKVFWFKCTICSGIKSQKRRKPGDAKKCKKCFGKAGVNTMYLCPPPKGVVQKKKRSLKEWYREEYLRSDLWKTIRHRVLERDKHTCFRCHGTATQVHHRSYSQSVMDGNDDSKLISLCRECHNYIEFDSYGNKLPLNKVNDRLEDRP